MAGVGKRARKGEWEAGGRRKEKDRYLHLHGGGREEGKLSRAISGEVVGESSLGSSRNSGEEVSGPAKHEVLESIHNSENVFAPRGAAV
jgi:hypothetical protein